MNLTPHFTLEELCHSQTADRFGLKNIPSEAVIAQLKYTAHGLELVRTLVQRPIIVSSGYRSPEVNRAVGSVAKESQHITGHAADILCPGLGNPAKLMEVIYKHREEVCYDQLLLEYASNGGGWVHISWSKRNRRQALVIEASGVTIYLPKDLK